MRTSLNKIKAIDDFLSGRMLPEDSLLFEANMLLDSDLVSDMRHQENTYAMIRQYGRKKIKEEIAAVQAKLAAAPQHQGFIKRIAQFFKKD